MKTGATENTGVAFDPPFLAHDLNNYLQAVALHLDLARQDAAGEIAENCTWLKPDCS